ncbi:hypothetical protein GCM10010468_74660 [Actinocorallia longicatena]|uniref:phospholipase D n=1 Tax=Actinocorallia longicatena TaxID=111803 RepID=A0ABP6QP18_9ACTN
MSLAAPVEAAAAKKIKSGIVFNDPRTRAGATKVENAIVSVIKGAPGGSKIRMSMYQFTDAYIVANALIAAKKRGVDVRIIADHTSLDRWRAGGKTTAYEKVAAAVGGKAKTCPAGRGCVGKQMNHNKFFLFSRSRGSKNVVIQTSQNLMQTGGLTTDWNDAVVLADNPGAYNAYNRYFNALWAGKSNLNIWKTLGGPANGAGVTVQFFPKASGDPVAGMLNKVSCTWVDYGGGKHPTEVRMAMSDINVQREWVLSALTKLKKKGCVVEVLTTIDTRKAPEQAVLNVLRAGGITTDYADPNRTQNLMHSKYILVKGRVGKRTGFFIWTGSANMTFGALRSSDETMIQLKRVGTLKSAKIHALYLCNFRKARAFLYGQRISC